MPLRINIPPLTRSLLIGLVGLTLLNAVFLPRGRPLLRVGNGVPAITIVVRNAIFLPWVFVTSTLVEGNFIGLLITGLTLFYGGRYLERAWSSHEFARFIAITAVIPNLLTYLLYLIAYLLSRNKEALTATVSGGISLQAAFLVAFKQLVPEHTVAILRGLLRIRVKHFPAIFLAANTVSGIVFGTETATLLAWFGFLTSWVYLRFYRLSEASLPAPVSSANPLHIASTSASSSSTLRGDASDTFAFAHFFPEPIHTPAARLADIVYSTLLALKICQPFSEDAIDAGNEQAAARADGGLSLPSLMNPMSSGGRGLGRTLSSGGGGGRGARREEAERRRALALKALDQRLHAAGSRSKPPPPQQQQQRGATTAGSSAAGPSSTVGASTTAGVAAAPFSSSGQAASNQPASVILGETSYDPEPPEESRGGGNGA